MTEEDKSRYLDGLKLWAVRTALVIGISILTALVQRLGIAPPPAINPPELPPLQVVIQPGPDKTDPFTGAKAWAVPVEVK